MCNICFTNSVCLYPGCTILISACIVLCKDSIVNCTDNLEKCNYQSNMPGTILYYNPEQLNSCKLFIWDAPDYQYNYNMYKNCKGQNCKGWRRSTLHLYSE